jgi:hypothetical protein
VNVLEDRRVLGQRQVIQVTEPAQRLIHPGVTGDHGVPGGASGGGRAGHHRIVLRHVALLGRVAGRFSDERYRPQAPGRATNGWRHAHGVINGQEVAQWTLCGKGGDMATAEECRTALEALAGRLSEVDPQKRAAILADRTLSCTVTDLGVTFVTKLGPDGASPVTEASPGDPPAQVRFSAASDELLAISGDPKRFVRSWLSGKVKVNASLTDILRLRKLL